MSPKGDRRPGIRYLRRVLAPARRETEGEGAREKEARDGVFAIATHAGGARSQDAAGDAPDYHRPGGKSQLNAGGDTLRGVNLPGAEVRKLIRVATYDAPR